MAFRVRSSKYRHVFGSPYRKELCYENVRITKNAHDSNFCAVNPKFLAVVTESSGGGSFLTLPLERTGRVDINAPKVCGHAGAVLDIKWNPFDDYIVASAADDNTVKIWRIPEDGLHSNLTEWQVDLHGHQRKVTYVEWHPTAANIMLSVGMDHKCFLWNIEQAEPVSVMNCHNNTVFSITWNREGSLFSTTCKDKKIRVIDPRCSQVAIEGDGHLGVKASKAVFLGNTQRIFTTGFSKFSERQYAVWDVRNILKPMKQEVIDFSSGILFPFYDHDTKVIFIAGKGDGNIRYYELVSDDPFCHYLSQYQSSSPQRSLGIMPKRGCDASRCEIVRFYKLHTAKSIVEPVSMIVPRKSEQFQDDIFPPTASCIPSLTADEWISGQNRDPILLSLQDGHVTNSPPITSAIAVQKQDGTLAQTPTITTFKAVNRPNLIRSSTIATTSVSPNSMPDMKEPASLKNIKRLSSNDEFLSLIDISLGRDTNASPVNTLPAAVNEHKLLQKPSVDEVTANGITSPDTCAHATPASSPAVMSSPFSMSSSSSSSDSLFSERLTTRLVFSPRTLAAPYQHRIHVKKVWSPPPVSPQPPMENGIPQTDPELRKAYFQQVEEIKCLKEQLQLKDKRIRQLEEEVKLAREANESNC